MSRLLASRARPAAPWSARHAGEDYGATASPDWRETNWSDYLREVEVDGTAINYVDIGEQRNGPTVVFVHGLAGCWQNWLENVPRVVAEGRRVLALDLPGFGFSPMPRAPITISGYGRAVAALCDAAGVDRAVLVGNSMGGFIAAECAIQFPQLVERLVLVSAAGITTTDLARRPLLGVARLIVAATTQIAARSEQIAVRPRLRTAFYAGVIRHPQRIATDLVYEITRGAGRPGFLPALDALTDYDFRDRLTDIEAPTLIVWGEDDMLVPVADADEFERLIPNARKLIFEDTGHVSMIERPPTFNDVLAEFLADQPSGSAGEAVRESAPAH